MNPRRASAEPDLRDQLRVVGAESGVSAILDRLAALNEHPPVIILSSRSYEAQSLRDFDRFGVVACLPKAIGPRALVQSLHDAGCGAHAC